MLEVSRDTRLERSFAYILCFKKKPEVVRILFDVNFGIDLSLLTSGLQRYLILEYIRWWEMLKPGRVPMACAFGEPINSTSKICFFSFVFRDILLTFAPRYSRIRK